MNKTFLAVNIPASFREKVYSIQGNFSHVDGLLPQPNSHITVRFLGETPDTTAVEEAARPVISGVAPFKIRLRGLAFDEWTLHVTVAEGREEFTDLNRRVNDSLLHSLGREPNKTYVPHMTLYRRALGQDSLGLGEIVERHDDFELGEFVVSGVSYYESVMRDGPSLYRKIADLPLGEQARETGPPEAKGRDSAEPRQTI
ncbi:MAG: RNA 2',3'-cyclic phosphodiesterase [Candidatus Aenigmatarchaeota archaeon]|nr:MAG: RNA 2',3'-cyclic phosphodiesterase [Candidatus Aenigmarchaeota archaeon]